MAITVEADVFLTAIKSGLGKLAKVKDAAYSISARKGKLVLLFAGSSIRYERSLPCEGKLERVAFDATLLYRMASNFKGPLSIEVDSTDLIVKHGKRSTLKIPANVSDYDYGDASASVSDASTVEEGMFSGWLKKHPLTNAAALRKALSSIKDNVTPETELVVDLEWGGGSDILKVKIVDQFHGILAYVKLKESMKKRVNIRLPISSFLLLLDIDGEMYVDGSKVLIRNEEQSLQCKFIAGSAFGSIDDMVNLIGQAKPQITVPSKDFLNIVKRVVTISEQDDYLSLSANGKRLLMEAKTTKASISEAIATKGELSSVALSPKNLQDIALCLTGDVSLTDSGAAIIFKSAKDDIVINGALVKMEV